MKKLLTCVTVIFMIGLITGCQSRAGIDEYNKGVSALKAGKYEEANKLFNTAISENGERPEYYISNGMALLQLKSYEDALNNFQKAVVEGTETEDNQLNKRSYRGMGIAYYYLKNGEKAVENLNKALAYKELPDLNEDAYLYLGTSYDLLKDDEKAYDAYSKVLELESENLAAIYGQYRALTSLERKDEAKTVLEKGLACTPKTMDDKFIFAQLQFYHKDYDEAEEELNEAIGQGYNEAYLFLGRMSVARDKYKKAIKYFEQYMEATGDEENVVICNQMAVCYIEQFNYKKAKTWVEKGVAIEASDSELLSVRYNQVLVYEKLRKFKEAYKLAKEYTKLYPDDKALKDEKKYLKNYISGANSADKVANPSGTDQGSTDNGEEGQTGNEV